jgi:signal transduction histidine kinase
MSLPQREAPRASRPSQFSILAKGLLLVSGPLVFQILLLIVLFNAQQAAMSAERLAAHSREVIVAVNEIHRTLLEMVVELRGDVISGGPSAGASIADQMPRVRRLRELVRDNAEQSARAAALERTVGDLQQWLRVQRQRLETGEVASVVAAIRAREGSQRLVATRGVVTALVEAEALLERQRLGYLSSARARERWLLVGLGLAGLAIAAAAAYLFSRSIAGRLAAVSQNAARLADGQTLAPPLDGDDEIADLDRVLHATARELARAADESARYKAALERKAADLTRLNHELHQQAQENELFIYSVSHDLRSPLVNLQGFSKELTRSCDQLRRELTRSDAPADLRARTAELLDRELPESVHYIRSAVTRSAAIIDALLRLSRAGRVEYRLQAVDLDAIARNVLDAMRSTIVERGATVEVQPLGTVWGDPTAVEQIVANVVQNAVHYLDPARPGRIEIGVTAHADASGGPSTSAATRTFYVRDNGLGIPAAQVDKVFVAFQRLHASHAAGEGIGLALVRRMVERHGGHIWVESVEGTGSTFYVTLPSEPWEARTAEAGEPAA